MMEALKKQPSRWLYDLFLGIRETSLRKVLIFIYLFLFTPMAYTQNKHLQYNSDFETFDIEKFNQMEGSSQNKKEILSDGTVIFYYHIFQNYSCVVYPPNSYVGLNRNYYENGNIKSKGLVFTKKRFRVGIWYYYDEKCKLIEERDHDKPYKFTLQEMLELVNQEGVTGLKTPEVFDTKSIYPCLDRIDELNSKNCWWELSKITDDELNIETIRFDCITGKQLSRKITPRIERAKRLEDDEK